MKRPWPPILTLILTMFCLHAAPAHAEPTAALRARAWDIAARSVRHNTVEDGGKFYLLAGGHQFHALWARDFAMAVQGALGIGQTTAVRDSLDVLFASQRADGLMPRAIDNMDTQERVILGLLGIVSPFGEPLKAWFETENHVITLDSDLIVPWAASVYLAATGDQDSARRWFEPMQKAIDFAERGYQDGLLLGHQPPFSDWEDSIRRTGRVALTNIYYLLALQGAASWSRLLARDERTNFYQTRFEAAKQAFHDAFWDPDRHVLRNFDGDAHLTADANLMAVAYHLLPPEEETQVLQALQASPLWWPYPGRATWPRYPVALKDFFVELAGIGGYHDTYHWLWISALAARAEAEAGDCASYQWIMDRLSAQIVHDGTFYEILTPYWHRLRPVMSWLYHAERPLDWSAAMYLEASARGLLLCGPPPGN